VPAAGGIRVMLVATDADIEKKRRPRSRTRRGACRQGAVVFGDQSRSCIEIGDDALNVFNMLQIVNTAKRPVQTCRRWCSSCRTERSRRRDAGRLHAERGRRGQEGDRHRAVRARATRSVQFAYSIPLGNEHRDRQKLPAQMTQLSVIAQKIGGMQMTSPQLTRSARCRATVRPSSSVRAASVKAGDTVTLTLSGLPHRSTWPAMSAVILGLSFSPPARGAQPGRTPQQDRRRAQLQARRDKLFSELDAARGTTAQGHRGRARLRHPSRASGDRARGPLRGARTRGRVTLDFQNCVTSTSPAPSGPPPRPQQVPR
jgi:hypothetical protein